MSEKRFELAEILQHAIDAESTLGVCCTHLSALIHNGKVRSQFGVFAKKAEENKKFLITYLEILGVRDFVFESKCELCKMKPESFSLSGALNVALEIVEVSVGLLKQLSAKSSDQNDKKLFKKLLSEKNTQRDFLKKEQEFNLSDKELPGCVGEYCIPQVIGKIV